MRQSYGQNQIATVGVGLRALAAPETGQFKAGGVTIDWASVAAVAGADVTLTDGTVIAIGDKYIRYGTVISKITASGKYGPANTGNADGTQLVTAAQRGSSFILDHTVIQSRDADVVGGCLYGGLVFRDHLNIGGSGQPAEADVITMFPQINFVRDRAAV